MGRRDVLRQALAAGLLDALTIIVAPVLLGGGKRLFAGPCQALDLEQRGGVGVAVRDVPGVPRAAG